MDKTPKSFLSWQGGKGRLIPEIVQHFPTRIRNYYEPFLGGGSVALAIAPRAEGLILSDKNACLINAWQCVRENPDGMTALMEEHKRQHDRGHHKKSKSGHYYAMLNLYNQRRGWGLEFAARFVYLNKTCFNGCWRANKDGLVNVPLGDRCYIPKFRPVADQVANAAIVHSGYEIIEAAEYGDAVYLDPPYYADREIASDYGVGCFTKDDRARMAALAANASRRGAMIVGSDLDTPYTRSLYSSAGFALYAFDYVYCVGGAQKARFISSELIYHNLL
jgi:DNA adenine methylase